MWLTWDDVISLAIIALGLAVAIDTLGRWR